MNEFYREQIKFWEWFLDYHKTSGNAKEYERGKYNLEGYKNLLENCQVNVPFEAIKHG